MKLKNKKTGEIGELQITEKHCAVAVGNGTANCGIEIYSSLAELNEEWKDYEEPKEYWFIDTYSYEVNYLEEGRNEDLDNFNKEIGNYFETREEAEKAVEKLKAWKRLKDYDIRFSDWLCDFKHNEMIEVSLYRPNWVSAYDDSGKLRKDLDLLFSGGGE